MSNYHGCIRSFGEQTPNIGRRVFVDPSALVMGNVSLGDDVSVWPQVAVRGDMHRICIGARTNIQDGSVLHITHAGPYNEQGWPLVIGKEVTIGHNATLHGCTVGDRVLVGMGAIVMDGAVVEDDVVVAAGALVTPGKTLSSGFLYSGSPARKIRALSEDELAFFFYSANNYVDLKNQHIAELKEARQDHIRKTGP
ncbi:MAG: gamma carbonic anhydrase family protein [Halieaceae bacterium]|jgi:carbonic anhydrase/acetyltransferase-like protein (isoleucine patch superfamily)|nr:gamma carbonic anhydrase family protein [Halieaceae bacterium]